MSEINLLPCPFCGEPPELDTQQSYMNQATGNLGTAVAVYCTKCPVQMSLCREDIPELSREDFVEILVEKWNVRTKATPVCVGYVSAYEALGLREPFKDSVPWVSYRQSKRRFVPVYLDPAPCKFQLAPDLTQQQAGQPAPPPEQECEHRKITYCHGSSLWVCADCDERFNADEFSRLLLEPPEEGMTIKGDGASELGKLMREQRQSGPVPHA